MITRSEWPTPLLEITRNLKAHATEAQLLALETLPARRVDSVPIPARLDRRLVDALTASGVSTLYRHQAEAVNAALDGKDVMVTTSTASGKTLCFNLPVLDAVLRESATKAVYLYPTKALGNDQHAGLSRLTSSLSASCSFAVFTGDTPKEERQQIRSRPPNILIANPDIVHFQQLAYHAEWEPWWENLRFIVVDEAHVYRGVFGSHVAHVLRRMIRIAAHYGARPQVIAASATVGNPIELVTMLAGRSAVLIDRDGSPRSTRHIALWQPAIRRMAPAGPIYESADSTSASLLAASLIAGKSAIAFARSRPMVERIRRETERELQDRGRADLVPSLASYRAGYDAARRREIERQLRDGTVKGVVATVALELGIDIGSLDVAILTGYPGTTMGFWQQAGRAGRRDREAMVVMVASQNPLDQYLGEHPRHLLDAKPEDAALDPANPPVAFGQLACAARELWLKPADSELYGVEVMDLLPMAEAQGWVVRERRGWKAATGRGRPDEVSLRSIDDQPYALLAGGRQLGEIGSKYIPREAHPGAIYLHDGDPYRVMSVDSAERVVRVVTSDEGLLTNPIGYRRINETATLDSRRLKVDRLKQRS